MKSKRRRSPRRRSNVIEFPKERTSKHIESEIARIRATLPDPFIPILFRNIPAWIPTFIETGVFNQEHWRCSFMAFDSESAIAIIHAMELHGIPTPPFVFHGVPDEVH